MYNYSVGGITSSYTEGTVRNYATSHCYGSSSTASCRRIVGRLWQGHRGHADRPGQARSEGAAHPGGQRQGVRRRQGCLELR